MVGLSLEHILASEVMRKLRGPDMLCDGVSQELEERDRSSFSNINCNMKLDTVKVCFFSVYLLGELYLSPLAN